MLERLADYDDDLMEQLLSDVAPEKQRVFGDLTKELREGLIVPVLLGSAEHGNGILRLLKALRHEAPQVGETARRLKIENAKSAAYVFKNLHTKAGGKLSFARVLTGEIPDSATVVGKDGKDERVAGIFTIKGEETVKRGAAKAGDTVALGRLEHIQAGETITLEKGGVRQIRVAATPEGVLAIGLGLKDRKDEVKLSAAVAKLVEEDPSLRVEHTTDTHQILLFGQGEMHLRVALERLARKYGIEVVREPRRIAYKETIKSATEIRARHKKQSGGHGQFGDVKIEIRPLPRGSGILFDEKITGGAVPKNYIPSVEIGVRDYLEEGPLGFPCVDIGVTLTDGSYHSVDSSDMAFRQAGRLAMSEGMPKCTPILLGARDGGRHRRAVGSQLAHQRHHLAASRPDSRLRRAGRVAGLGRHPGAHPGLRDGQPDRRLEIRDGGRRVVHLQVRSSLRAVRALEGSGARRTQEGGGIGLFEQVRLRRQEKRRPLGGRLSRLGGSMPAHVCARHAVLFSFPAAVAVGRFAASSASPAVPPVVVLGTASLIDILCSRLEPSPSNSGRDHNCQAAATQQPATKPKAQASGFLRAVSRASRGT